MGEQNKNLIDLLFQCAMSCNQCAVACLDEHDVKNLTRCIKLDMDCSEICRLTANLLSRDSARAELLLTTCAEICYACAEECDRHAKMGMEHCRKCAETCRKCADACESGVAA